MSEDTPPPAAPAADEPEVQGVPRSLVSSLCGVGGLLTLAGLLCAAYAAWDSWATWGRVSLVLAPPVVILALHIVWVRRLGLPVFTPAFGVYMAANMLLPLGLWLAENLGPLAGVVGALVYAAALIWYGASCRNAVAISAACMLCFAAALSVPLYLGVSMVVGSVLLLSLGAAALGAAFWLYRLRARRLAQLYVARKRQEQDRTVKQID